MTKMTILRGVSGSGKSTWARQQNAAVVSRDDIRVMQFGSDGLDYYTVPKEELWAKESTVTVIQNAMIDGLLRAGKDVIVDNTNTQFKFVKELAKIGYRHGAEVEVKLFDVPLADAMLRAQARSSAGGRYVSDDVIKRQYEAIKMNKNHVLEPVSYPAPYEGTPGRPDAFMFDLDGTTYHMNDKRGPYEENVDVDDPDLIVQEVVMRLMASGLVGIGMSGRKERTRALTEIALERDDITPDELFMRADDDNRSDNLIKADLFDAHVRDNYNVLFVIDDRRQVVDMWLRMGLKVLNVAGIDGGDF